MPVSEIPPDAVTSSGSGLDPDISPQYAAIQVDRVAAARHLPVATVQSLVSKYTQGRNIGFLGEPRVDVLTSTSPSTSCRARHSTRAAARVRTRDQQAITSKEITGMPARTNALRALRVVSACWHVAARRHWGAGMEPLSANDPRMIGEFRLHARLGAGGMGQVYLGFSPAGRAVAIKVIHPQFARDQEFLRRFSHEVAAASAVGGMYTAPVVDSDLNDSPPWLATAYVPGPTLAAVVSKHGPLPEAAVWRLAAGLAEALRAVHATGLVHRDLKPANVLLADNGPHVIDFGISRAFRAPQLTSAGMVIGTPGYMSPEQAEGRPAGPASDIFSLGCVLAYAATGHPPFGGETPRPSCTGSSRPSRT